MRNWFFLLIILIFAVFEAAILDYFKIFGAKPNLMLITVVIASLFFELKWAIAFSIFAGALKDIFSITAFGINTLLFPLWSFLIMELSKRICLDNNFVRVALIFILGIFNEIIFRFMFAISNSYFIPTSVFLRIAILGSLYSASLSPLIFKGMDSLIKHLPVSFGERRDR